MTVEKFGLIARECQFQDDANKQRDNYFLKHFSPEPRISISNIYFS